MLNELLSLTPPKVRKRLFLWQHIYRENYPWISNHTDHQPLADASSIRAQNDERDVSKKSITKCQDNEKKETKKEKNFSPTDFKITNEKLCGNLAYIVSSELQKTECQGLNNFSL